MGGGPSSVNQTSTTSPPSWAIPYYQQYLSQLGSMTTPGTPSPYALGQVAPFSPLQTEAQQAIQAMGPTSPTAQAGQDWATGVLQGQNLGPNPLLNQYAQAASQGLVNQYQTATAPEITSQAVAQGGLGGSGYQQAQETARYGLGQNLQNLMAGIYEPAYQFDRSQQAAAAGQVPSLVQAGYIPAQAMAGAGGQQQTQLQNILNTGQQNLNQQAQWPYQSTGMLGSGLGNVTGGSQVTVGTNPSQGMK